MIKKGINIWSFPQGTIKDSLTLAKKAGFEGVELALNGEGELSMQSTEAEIKEVKKVADDLGLALYSLSCGLCWDYRLSDDDPAMREKAKDMIKKTDKRRINYYNFYTGRKWGSFENYHVSINSSVLGVEKTAQMIAAMARIAMEGKQ